MNKHHPFPAVLRLPALAILLALSVSLLTGCFIKLPFSGEPGGESSVQTGDATCDGLIADTETYLSGAAMQSDIGNTFAADFLYGMAQAEISSLRLCIDTVLWLKGEGKNLAEVIGNAPYRTWDEITGAGLGSDAPAYFEGLVHTFRGETEEAEELKNKAEKNPNRKERDFYFLRNLSVEELKKLKETVSAEETRVSELYSPRSRLLADRTCAEFSPHYHLALAQEKENENDLSAASQSALNALLTDPAAPALYATAAAYAMQAGNAALAYEILNEGLQQFPEEPSVLFIAAMYSYAAGDTEAAAGYAAAAKQGADAEMLEKINALEERMGGAS